MNRKVACYARVSTDQQSSGLESQVRTLKEYCEKNGIKDFEIFTDENYSGAKSSRPALDRMMTAVKNKEISTVIARRAANSRSGRRRASREGIGGGREPTTSWFEV